jgi:hypothetical protein
MSDSLDAALKRIETQIEASERDLARQCGLLAQIAEVSPERQQRAAEAFKRARARVEEVTR